MRCRGDEPGFVQENWIWNLGAMCWAGARETCPALRAMSRLILGFC
jgi:hypothetical protein